MNCLDGLKLVNILRDLIYSKFRHTFWIIYLLCKGCLTKKESDNELCKMTWPKAEPSWDDSDHRVKIKLSTRAQHQWTPARLLQVQTAPHVADLENTNDKAKWDKQGRRQSRKLLLRRVKHSDLFCIFCLLQNLSDVLS